MLKPKSPQESFYGSYLYDRIVPVDHLTGLVRKCRENVLQTIEKQDTEVAERLGLKELQHAEQVRFLLQKKGLSKRLKLPVIYLIALRLSLR